MKCILLLYYLFQIQLSQTFYVPGVAPQEYQIGDVVSITAVTVYSTKTQLPYDYTHLGLCDPIGGKVHYKSENLGEILSGNRIVDTPYKVQMNVEADCAKLCGDNDKPRILNKEQSVFIREMIKDSYYVDLRADGLPCATKFLKLDTEEVMYEKGYKLGYVNGQDVFLYNHLKFTFKYHSEDLLTYRVVGCDVEPMSISLGDIKIKDDNTCQLPTDQSQGQPINSDGETRLGMTYSVKWEKSKIRWASRWDPYLTMKDAKIHWFSIINSLVIIFLLSGILAMIIIRTLRKDIARYNREEDLEDTLEESGWKLVHGDVFRPPRYPVVFCALIGSGIQIFSMSLITLVFAMLGMLSPASRGALMTAAIFLYVFMGMFAGYYSSRLYKTVKGALWKKTALYTATLYPGTIFGICFFLNFFIWGKHSSGAVPFTTMLAILCLWFGISLPLVYVGSYFGFRKQPYGQPVRTNQIPRQIPDQPWYMNSFVSSLAAGVLPFGGTFIELFFIFTAIWENQFYYLFGFLFIVFIILVVSCAQISIVMVYFQLCNEDYRWWWKSFSVFGGGSALYVLGYSIFYFFTKLDITGFTPTLLYAGYTAIMVLTFWLLTGVVGFYASYFFIRSIYSAVKID